MRNKHTSAYMEFENVVGRALNLLSHEEKLGNVITEIDFSDLIRAGIVLAVAAMDAYFTNVFTELLIPYLKRKGPTPAIIDLLESAGFDTELAVKLLACEDPYARIHRLIEKHLDRRTTHRPDAINELFIAYGLKNFCEHAEQLAHRKTLLSTVNKLVDRRNAIAHGGDLNPRGELQRIARQRAARDIRSLVLFVAKSEELIAKSMFKGRQ